MNPDFLKHLQQITAALRGGLVFNPLDELQKRATQYGEGVGTQLEHDRAVGAYSQAHPESQRARQEVMTNAAMLALGSIKPGERPSLVPAIKTLDGKIVDGITHAHAYMDAGISEPLPTKNEGYVDLSKNKFYTRQAAEKLMKNFMSPSVKNQVAERSRQAGKDMGITTEDLNGKLYANRGTRADPPMTLADMDRIVAKKNGSKLPANLQGKEFKNDADKRIRGALWENTLKAARAARAAETAAAEAANAKKYNLDTDSRAALKRGDLQRKTGTPQDGDALGSRLHGELSTNGGFTIDPATGEALTSGYSVGGGEKSGVLLKKPLADLKPSELQSFLVKNKSKLQPGQAWGGWVDNGHVYVEPADQVADLNTAQRLGNERGEKAIWDHANKAEIPLKASKQETAATHAEEFANVLDRWRSVWDQYTKAGHEVSNLHSDRRASLLHALRFPDILKPK